MLLRARPASPEIDNRTPWHRDYPRGSLSSRRLACFLSNGIVTLSVLGSHCPPRWALILKPESQHSVMTALWVNPPPPAADWPRKEEEGSDFSSALQRNVRVRKKLLAGLSSNLFLPVLAASQQPAFPPPHRCLWPAAIQGRRQGLKVMPGF